MHRPHKTHTTARTPGFSLCVPAQRLTTPTRAAFTLVEMLVSTAIVLIMLLLFAQIFGTAVGTMREQQALAQNDQKARSLETVVRNDLNKATFRQPRSKGVYGIVPLTPNGPIDAARQRGFFYISENDIEDATDDVLHFTIDLRQNHRDPVTGALRGRATPLGLTPLVSAAASLAPADDLNQPAYDDGDFDNGVGQSPCAEVSYFVRGGNLYRRVLLLRDPPQSIAPGSPAEFATQPGVGPSGSVSPSPPDVFDRKFVRDDGSGVPVPADYSTPSLDAFGATLNTMDFWNDFDYSAWNWWRDINVDGIVDPFSTDQHWLMFNGADSLLNTPGATPFPIAQPQHRFGHRPRLDGIDSANALRFLAGQPMEYLLSGGPAFTPLAFIGRFTHEETSHRNFGYPGVVPLDGITAPPITFHPFYDAYGVVPIDADQNQVIDGFQNGPRAGEDILLSGIESFDIEVWDEGFSETDLNGDGVVNLTGPMAYEDRNGNNAMDSLSGLWVNLGHGGIHPTNSLTADTGLGHYRLSQFPDWGMSRNPTHGRTNPPYGPRSPAAIDGNRVFDTWHPNALVGDSTRIDSIPPDELLPYQELAANKPPFQPLRIPLVAQPGAGAPSVVGWQWGPGATVTYGAVFFPGVEDLNDNGVQDFTAGDDVDLNGNGILDPSDPSYYYIPVKVEEDLNGNRIIDAADGDDTNGNGTLEGFTGDRQPEWPREPGATVVDGGVVWQCFDNRIGLQMIRITVRYRDLKSGLPRQLSLIHSFVE